MVAAGVLTLISFALKGMGMLFRVYLSGRMGASGLGLYQLVLSVYSIFSTFATSGFGVAVSRLAAERLGDEDNRKGAVRVLVVSSALSLAMGAAAALVLYAGADFFATTMVGDRAGKGALRILALSMPFMSLSACLKGYFTAVGQIYKPSIASLFEQVAKIAITVYMFSAVYGQNATAEGLCNGVVAGITAGECLSYVFLFLLYIFFSGDKRAGCIEEPPFATLKTVAGVSLPIAACAYVTNILHSVESVLIPGCFTRFGGGREQALADFGLIRGMSIPLLFFPYAFLGALLSIQVPAVSKLNVGADRERLTALVGRIIRITVGFSLVCGGFFCLFPKEVSMAVYGNVDCAYSLRILALVTPLMYIETMCDGLLKTVGQQNRTLLYSVLNSVLRIGGVLFLVPLSGVKGYLALLLVSNTFSFVLCYFRLKKVTGFRYGVKTLVGDLLKAALALGLAYGAVNILSPQSPMVYTVIAAVFTAVGYFVTQKDGWRQC